MILITGSEGLIGHQLIRYFHSQNIPVAGIDLKPSTIGNIGFQGNILDLNLMGELISQATGIIHLAAVSRVVDGQKNPELCNEVNVTGTQQILEIASQNSKKPWIIYSSSREVYGHATEFPVAEHMDLVPVNVYGESKNKAEKLVNSYEGFGNTAIVRFSNVYGSVDYDHYDRVVPAFAQAAAYGSAIRIDGSHNSFDFTHLSDTVDGVLLMCEKLKFQSLPPIHFVTGQETTLGELAEMARGHSYHDIEIIEAPSRDYDVSKFYGSYERAKFLLGWAPKIFIKEGLRDLIQKYRSRARV